MTRRCRDSAYNGASFLLLESAELSIRANRRRRRGAKPRGLSDEIARLPEVMERPPELRSEEHTSELQSRSDIVCRLLLEKKKFEMYRAAPSQGEHRDAQ